jgi:hypothetical protein
LYRVLYNIIRFMHELRMDYIAMAVLYCPYKSQIMQENVQNNFVCLSFGFFL